MAWLTWVAVSALLVNMSTSLPTTSKKNGKGKAVNFFLKYGYMQDFSESTDDKIFSKTLKQFQKFAGLKVTGELNDETKKQFEIPRCGLSDPIDKVARRKRRYLLQGLKWDLSQHKDRTLTWQLKNKAKNLGKNEIRAEFAKALNLWQKHANIKFRETADKKADLSVKFGTLCHSDPFCFDNKGGTLAHAFYPYPGQEISGDVHFDDDEDYVIGKSTGTDLLWVATHEVGHSLGLEHSNVKGAIMFPWYQGYKKDFDLTQDDIEGIQELYGPADPFVMPPIPDLTTTRPSTITPSSTTAQLKPTTSPLTTTTVPTTTTPSTTTTMTTTTVKPTRKPTAPVRTSERVTELKPSTAKPYQTRTTEGRQSKTTDSPRPTEDPYTNNRRFRCTKAIDAAYISQKFKWMIVFAENRMYLANRNGIRHGPLLAKKYFPLIIGNIDSVLENTATGETIFFSGQKFWIYRGFTRIAGPLSLEDLGIDRSVRKIDATLKWKRNGQYYLFSGTQYWRFNPSKPRVVEEGYPKAITRFWHGIPSDLSEAITDFDGITRFAKADRYYTLIDRAVTVDVPNSNRIGTGWMNCRVKRVVPRTKVQDYNGPLIAEP